MSILPPAQPFHRGIDGGCDLLPDGDVRGDEGDVMPRVAQAGGELLALGLAPRTEHHRRAFFAELPGNGRSGSPERTEHESLLPA